jgi:hypothetical protein
MTSIYSNPKSWGSPAWVFLHCISLTYPKKPTVEERAEYKVFFESLVHVLPCPSCRVAYEKWIHEHPIDPFLSSRKKLSEWVIDLHNDVNFRNQSTVMSRKKALSTIKKDCRKYKKIATEMNNTI